MSKITGKKCLLISLAVSLALIIAGAFVFGFIGFNPDSVTKDYSKVEVSYYGNQLNSDDFLAEIESLCADTIEDGGYKISETRRSDEAPGSKRLFEFILGSDLTAEQSASLVSDLETALRAKTVSGDVTVAEDDDVTVAYISDVEYVPHYEYIWRTAIGGGAALVLLFAYVAIRFKVGMGVTSLVAAVHDVLLTLALIALFRIPMSTAVIGIAACSLLLSVFMNLFVFGRMRKDFKLEEKKDLPARENVELSAAESRKGIYITAILAASVLVVLGVIGAITGLNLLWFMLGSLVAVGVSVYSSLVLSPAIYARIKEKSDAARARKAKYNYESEKKNKKAAKSAEKAEPVSES